MMGGEGPLHGLRVVELTTAWAGPMAGRVLAFLGADVIHVEHATRPDLWRQHGQAFRPRVYPGRQGGDRPYNRNALFNSQNLGKRGVCLDIKQPQGLALLHALIAQSDVVLSNFAPGALARAGLGYERLQAINPAIIVVEVPAYGNTGPMSRASAVGMAMEMACGMASLTGYAGGDPVCTGPHYMDPIGAYNAAAAVMTALLHRDATGAGQYVEVPQVEAAMQYIGAELLHAGATQRDPRRQGNRVDWAAPHDAFRASGEDEWVAIAVTSDAAWQAFRGVVGDPRLDEPRFETLAGRLAAQDELDVLITAWTATRSKHEIAARLQAAGVAAAPVQHPGEALEDDFLAARGFFTVLQHPEAGTHPYGGVPIHLTRTPGRQLGPAPCLGQHTREVLGELLQLDDAALDALEEAGITSAVPPGSDRSGGPP